MDTTPVTVLTIVRSRQEALANLIAGLEASELHPAELVIVHMNEPESGHSSPHFPIRAVRFDAHEKLPLAAARNFAAARAAYPLLIFLDVDCIPSAHLVRQYTDALQSAENLWAGPVRYLGKGATDMPGFLHRMEELSSPDPVRGDLGSMSHALFWSLNFACSKTTYNRIGGFDTRFTGYGAEDTDFGFAARARGVPLGVTGAVAYHQYHPSYDPPLNHLKDILSNANAFYNKWKVWPMEGWLRKFVRAGLIEWENDTLRILRLPDEQEIRAALKSG